MFGSPESLADWQRGMTCIQVRDGHWNRGRAAGLLEALGGVRCLPEEGTMYRFISGVARDDALDLVRSKFGWTVADPWHGRPGRSLLLQPRPSTAVLSSGILA
jgi:hypothetical protein